MASVSYDSALADEATGALDFDTHSFKALFTSAAYIPDPKTHAKRSDITNEVTGTGWAAGGVAVAVTVAVDTVNDTVDINFAPIDVTPVTLSGVKKVVYYRSHGGAATADELVMCIELVNTLSPSGGRIRIAQSKYRKTRGGGGAIINVPANAIGVSASGATGTVSAFGTTAVNQGPQWGVVADFTATQGIAQTFDLAGTVADPEGNPMTLFVASGTLPTGWSVNNSLKRLQYDGVGPAEVRTGIVLGADDGVAQAFVTGITATGIGGSVTAFTSPDATANLVGVSALASAGVASAFGNAGGVAGYPTTYTIPTYTERFFGDVTPGHATWHATPQDKRLVGLQPGYYIKNNEMSTYWTALGGDWYDQVGFRSTASPYASATTAASISVDTPINFASTALTNLVKDWVTSTLPNYGFFMKCRSGGSTIFWRTRFYTTDPTKVPVLIVNTASAGDVTITARRSIWLNPTSTTLGGSTQMRTSASSDNSLLAFDLPAAGITNAADINTVTLRVFAYSSAGGAQTVDIYRVWNPADQTSGVPAQELGLAQNYTKDVGIEADPDVVFVERFVDGNLTSRMYQTGPSNYTIMTADDATTGFTKLAGLHNGCRILFTNGGLNSAFDHTWTPNRGGLNQIKGPQHVFDAYMRHYLMPLNDWNPQPDGGKAFGFDMRFKHLGINTPGILGMGRGNSSSYCDGLLGASARGHFGLMPAYDCPMVTLRTFGNSDLYNIDQTAVTGFEAFWPRKYLGALRKGQWHCVEQNVKMNSVSDPAALPEVVSGVTASGTTATASLASVHNEWTVGQQFQGTVGGIYEPGYNQAGTMTVAAVTPVTQLTYTVPAGLPANASVYTNTDTVPEGGFAIRFCKSVGLEDGCLRAWVNGRLCADFQNMRYRHSAWCVDRVTPFSVDAFWFCYYHGGLAAPGANFSIAVANIVVAKRYIGPLVGFP